MHCGDQRYQLTHTAVTVRALTKTTSHSCLHPWLILLHLHPRLNKLADDDERSLYEAARLSFSDRWLVNAFRNWFHRSRRVMGAWFVCWGLILRRVCNDMDERSKPPFVRLFGFSMGVLQWGVLGCNEMKITAMLNNVMIVWFDWMRFCTHYDYTLGFQVYTGTFQSS